MKTMIRYLVVLLIAVLVAYGLYWVIQNHGAALGINMAAGFGDHQAFQNGSTAGLTLQAPPAGDFGGHGHDLEDAQSLLPGLIGIAQNLGIFAALTLVVILMQKGLYLLFHRRRLQPS